MQVCPIGPVHRKEDEDAYGTPQENDGDEDVDALGPQPPSCTELYFRTPLPIRCPGSVRLRADNAGRGPLERKQSEQDDDIGSRGVD